MLQLQQVRQPARLRRQVSPPPLVNSSLLTFRRTSLVRREKSSRDTRLSRFQVLLTVGIAGLRIRLAQDRKVVERRGGGSRSGWKQRRAR